jgi:hypothetical protein
MLETGLDQCVSLAKTGVAKRALSYGGERLKMNRKVLKRMSRIWVEDGSIRD